MKHILTLLLAVLLPLCLIAQKKDKNTPAKPDNGAFTSATLSGLSFRSIGPAVTSGRIADFAVNPHNQSEYYVAAAAGGVWKTTDHGITFNPIFDGQGSYSIGCISLDPSNASVVWVGTGENNNQRSVSYGDGVYMSPDGGKSWQHKGLKNSEHIANIIVHPQEPATIYVAAYGPVWSAGGDRGVYKSTDGGTTWTCVKSVSEYTGCNDLVMDPRNPDVLYAAFHQRMRKVFTYIGGGPETALFKSIDGGATWTQLAGGLPTGDLGRMGLAISPVNPDVLYTVIEANDDKGGVYRSTDQGASWEKRGGTYTSGNYYQEITCDPKNVDRIYITDTYYQISDDGGKTTRNLGELNKHIDNHAIWIDPNNTDHLLVGCDGGVYETWNLAGTWDFKSNLPVTQFYKVSTDNAEPFYHVHGGTQDNLSLGGPSRTTSANGIVNSDWYVTSLGDGFETQVDPTDPNIIYAQAQYGALSRFDRRSGEYLYIKPVEGAGDPALRWNWDAPLLISQHNPTRLYFGANKLFRTDDRGNSWKVISPDLSRNIDRNKLEVMGRVWSVDAIAKNGSTDIYGQLTTIAESKFDPNLLWVGTDDGLLQKTTDGGASWTRYDNLPGIPEMCYVHQIITSLHDRNTVYVCFNHHRFGNFKPYVLKTTDGGATWKAIQSDLPERGSVYTIAEDHVDPNLLFVGTEFGCFFTTNGGGHWLQITAGLPTIAVRDIEIQRRENDLVLGTFGRGFYILDDYSALRGLTQKKLESDALLFPVKDPWMYVERYPIGLRSKGHLGSSYFVTPNPEVGAVFTYYLKDEIKSLKEQRQEREKAAYEKKEKVFYPSMDSLRMEDHQVDPYLLFTIQDRNGQVIRYLKADASNGLKRLVWDLRTAIAAPVNNRYVPGPDVLFGTAETGHLVAPGEYSVRLSKVVDGIMTLLTEPQSFTVKYLDQGSLPTDLAVSTPFLEKVSVLRKAVGGASDLLQDLQTRVTTMDAAVRDMPAPAADLLKKATILQQSLTDLNIRLNGDGTAASRQFETVPSISDRVFGIQGALWVSTAPVPKTYTDSYEVAKSQFTAFMNDLRSIDVKVHALEDELEANGAPYTPGRWPRKW
ncbi:MAG: glycosyl hydrolase [Saprospiraceae bacterium]|nr:glycosyl hydrolase [Saprospiraceae bacterium]